MENPGHFSVEINTDTKILLARIRDRQIADWAKSRAKRRKPVPTTVLFNSKGNSWTSDGFSTGFMRAKNKAGINKRLHDVRGTFVTWLASVGLSNEEIARIVGWAPEKVETIRKRYVDERRVVTELARRISAWTGSSSAEWSTGGGEDEDEG
ncbi:tyrosine-type recombinase/integrase [Sphingobium salicis]|uniref:tyrosine-type recombinase/integrase n=1 Tax=Sphingobium sp. HT1-2 TaxID=3111640 RepID=UPI003C2C5962